MLKIKTVCELTNLTDRTIRYYIEEGLISPDYTENYIGRRTFKFSENDVNILKNISVLRKYGFSITEIKEMISNPASIPRITLGLQERKQKDINEERELLEKLNQAIYNESSNITELAEFLSNPVENKPIPKEKQSIKKILVRILKGIVKSVIVLLPIAMFAQGFYLRWSKYLYSSFIWEKIPWAMIPLIPSIIMILLSKRMRKKHIKIIVTALCVLSIPFNFFSPFTMINNYSETTNPDNYFVIEHDCWAYFSSVCRDMFLDASPCFTEYSEELYEWVPIENTKYYYYYSVGLFHANYNIYAEWFIEQEELEKEIARIKTLFKEENNLSYVEQKKGNWECIILTPCVFETFTERENYDRYNYYIFAYNEKDMRVRYIASSNQEDMGDAPYQLSLEW